SPPLLAVCLALLHRGGRVRKRLPRRGLFFFSHGYLAKISTVIGSISTSIMLLDSLLSAVNDGEAFQCL
ncbi:hypothetical protein AA904_14225, partial [Geobacillus stearothermophilus]|uniref:hypothetical protein n=1 Tax=Geobacillus stearothermophilus TaxID=1422 RepID=UPI00066FE575